MASETREWVALDKGNGAARSIGRVALNADFA
jgi:hypothetical protein